MCCLHRATGLQGGGGKGAAKVSATGLLPVCCSAALLLQLSFCVLGSAVAALAARRQQGAMLACPDAPQGRDSSPVHEAPTGKASAAGGKRSGASALPQVPHVTSWPTALARVVGFASWSTPRHIQPLSPGSVRVCQGQGQALPNAPPQCWMLPGGLGMPTSPLQVGRSRLHLHAARRAAGAKSTTRPSSPVVSQRSAGPAGKAAPAGSAPATSVSHASHGVVKMGPAAAHMSCRRYTHSPFACPHPPMPQEAPTCHGVRVCVLRGFLSAPRGLVPWGAEVAAEKPILSAALFCGRST
jgi:hypothetical protein